MLSFALDSVCIYLTPLFMSFGIECKHENPGTCPTCSNAIEALITAFTNSVSEYLTGESPQNESYAVPSRDLQPPRKGLERANLKGLSKSHDNLSAKYSSFVDLCQPFSEPSENEIECYIVVLKFYGTSSVHILSNTFYIRMYCIHIINSKLNFQSQATNMWL